MLVIKDFSRSVCHIVIIPRYSFYNFIDRHIIRKDIPHGRSTSVLVHDRGDRTTAPSAHRGAHVLIETIKHHIRAGTLKNVSGDYRYLIPGDILGGGILHVDLIGRNFLSRHQIDSSVTPTRNCFISLNFEILVLGAGFKALKKKVRSMVPVKERDILRPRNWVKVENAVKKAREKFGSENVRLRVVHHAHIALRF